jgi:CheY-like chemotaxis protein
MRILIVEDEAIIALAIDNVLTDTGHNVVGIARDVATALAIAAAQRPDLALVDLNLANTASGAIAARHLLEMYGVPAIFVSGNPTDCRQVGQRAGALGCLSKPFKDAELIQTIAAAQALIAGGSPSDSPGALELYS